MKEKPAKLDVAGELADVFSETLKNDKNRRTYLRLALEGLARSAAKGNIDAIELLLRQVNLADVADRAEKRQRSVDAKRKQRAKEQRENQER